MLVAVVLPHDVKPSEHLLGHMRVSKCQGDGDVVMNTDPWWNLAVETAISV